MNIYKVLAKEVFSRGAYSIVPIRFEDRYKIMQWRNEQIYHLRQAEPLTPERQDWYFNHVVAKLFNQELPNQILFSFLKNEECIGYGGLVHINWIDSNAEVSLVLNTKLEKEYFVDFWSIYLSLLKRVAFKELKIHKIFTYAFDVRPKLYLALETSGFSEEARLKQHCKINNEYLDVVYHSCINPIHSFQMREANEVDDKLLFIWVNDPEVRQSALNSNPIDWSNHLAWFSDKLNSLNAFIYIVEGFDNCPVGQIRIELENGAWLIDYSVDKSFRGLGLGEKIVAEMMKRNSKKSFRAEVKSENRASQLVFEKLNFKLSESTPHVRRYCYPQ